MSGYYSEGPMSNWVEDRDMALLEKYRVWILDRKETLSSVTPFDLWCCQHNYDNRGLQFGHEAMAIPGCKGYDCRLKDGWVYVAVIPTTEEEKAKREVMCAERLVPWIEDFDREYHKYTDALMERYLPFQAIDMEALEDYQLQDAFDDWIEIYRRGGNWHFPILLAFAKIYTMFDEMCVKEAGFGVDDPRFSDLMAGFEQIMMQGDRGLFKLGVRAHELGLEPLFKETRDDEELHLKLEQAEAGRTWLKELGDHLWVYGWRSAENWDCGRPSWVEKPSLSFPSIRRFMARPTFLADELRPSLIAKREATEKEVLALVAEEKRPEFLKLMKAAQRCGPIDQDHVFYCEHYGNALARKVTKEVAKRFVAQGVIDDDDDIYYMMPDEISLRILGRYPAHELVAIRKRQHAEFRAAEPEMFIGDPTAIPWALASSPMLRATVASFPRVRPELGADLYATVSTPGVAEGEVCVLRDATDFEKFRPGAILVANLTNTAWTPLFSFAKAIVVDVGGVLSHSAVLGREYGIPVLAGCEQATKKLKDGMRVRVDGDLGAVWILEDESR
jgi:pyruvate,water dikinase